MGELLAALALVVAGVAIQDVLPGNPVYHYGWYNALIATLVVYAALRLPGIRKRDSRAFGAAALLLFGAGVVALTGIAAGLLGPDPQSIVGAPGASVRSADLDGSIVFGLAQTAAAGRAPSITFVHQGKTTPVRAHGRTYVGGWILWERPRSVVYVEASDTRGNHLTVTQPTNGTFLSPVLLMRESTTIAGMPVRFDTFAVPAAARSVKAVLFNAAQAAQLHATGGLAGRPAVLFAVSDDADHLIPGGIGLVPSGEQRRIGGLRLRAVVGTYPALVAVSAPYLPVFVLGLLIVAAGALQLVRVRRLDRAATA